MKLTNYLSAALVAFLVFACQPQTEKKAETVEESTEEAAAVEEAPAEVAVGVLNPNLASEEELLSTGLTDEQVSTIIDGRPHLDGASFAKALKEMAGDNYEAVAEKLFLSMNLNTTAEDDFKLVPGVGDKMAHEFEEYRPYTSVAQFRREIGKYVDEDQVLKYENFVFVPVNLNNAPKEQILMIPGVGEKMLHEFEEYRPYESIEQFRREIGKYVDDKELSRLERYVTLD